MKKINNPKLHDIKTLKKNISCFGIEFEKGDEVEILSIGERGYDLMEVTSGKRIIECGWDLFQE